MGATLDHNHRRARTIGVCPRDPALKMSGFMLRTSFKTGSTSITLNAPCALAPGLVSGSHLGRSHMQVSLSACLLLLHEAILVYQPTCRPALMLLHTSHLSLSSRMSPCRREQFTMVV